MATLVIKGHPTRGKEVIQLLEMLGGVNNFNLDGAMGNYYYYIDENSNKIYHCLSINLEYGIVYTLEEFEKLYPYKVGDKVTNEYKLPMIIFDVYWDNDFNVIKYNVRFLDDDKTVRTGLIVEELQPYKEENMEENIKEKCDLINFNSRHIFTFADSVELILEDAWEVKNKDGRTFVVRKQPQYPKYYADCCEVLGLRLIGNINNFEYKFNLLANLQVLLICRDAYWKIAGEEMGLGKPWEPDWNNLSATRVYIKINKGCLTYASRVFVFPTEEMRDTFFENFKGLIEECRELL